MSLSLGIARMEIRIAVLGGLRLDTESTDRIRIYGDKGQMRTMVISEKDARSVYFPDRSAFVLEVGGRGSAFSLIPDQEPPLPYDKCS